jgi:hypothetical protein
MDAFLRSDNANKNFGTHDSLLIGKLGKKSDASRVLIAVPQAAIADSVGGDSLVSATLEFTIKRTGTDWGTTGRPVSINRMSRTWTEAGATWNCANDLNPGNNKADCSANTWNMTGTPLPFIASPTDQQVIANSQTGVVSFVVTSDVRAMLAGQATNQGWLLKLATESQTGTVVFTSRESATKPRLILSVLGRQVPPQAPPTLPAWVYSSSNLDSNTTALGGVFLKNIVIVEFKPSASQSERQSAVDAVKGSVVGGVPSRAGEGHYYVSVPDSTQGGGLVSATQRLRSLPQVQLATYEFDVAPMYRKPQDNANWSSWHIDRNTLTGENWALEAVFAPLAWGCATGDSSLRVGVVDGGFPALPAGHDVSITVHPAPGGGNPLAGDHGIKVSSILAARGNNHQDITGMMWNAQLHGYEVGEIAGDEHAFVGRVLQQIKNAADDGARVINLSLSVLPHWADSTRVLAGDGLDATLSALGSRGRRPVVVVAAGNFALDASVAGFPRASRGVNGQQVIVVAASTKDAALWVGKLAGEGGSNYGSLVDVAAPGENVFFLTQTGAINHGNGTSAAAPIVSGIAGLLLSFDSTLQASDVKRYIVNGAKAGDWKATRQADGGQYAIVNAYEALKLAAQRPGAPLCGNRVWSAGGVITAQRGGSSEQLFSTGSPAGLLNVYHGGKRIDWTDQNSEIHTAILIGSSWTEVADRSGLTDTIPGATYRSAATQENDFWYSATHDNDKLIRAQGFVNLSDDSVVVQTSTDNGSSWTDLLSFHEFGSDESTIDYVYRKAEFDTDGSTFLRWKNLDSVGVGTGRGVHVNIRYYPTGTRALLEIRHQVGTVTLLTEFEKCPWASDNNGVNTEECRTWHQEADEGDTQLKVLDLATGQIKDLLTVSGLWIYMSGISEAEDEMMLIEERQHFGYDRVPRTDGVVGFAFVNSFSTQDQCQAAWHSLKTPSATPFRVVTADMCESIMGGGTISPSVGAH